MLETACHKYKCYKCSSLKGLYPSALKKKRKKKRKMNKLIRCPLESVQLEKGIICIACIVIKVNDTNCLQFNLTSEFPEAPFTGVLH